MNVFLISPDNCVSRLSPRNLALQQTENFNESLILSKFREQIMGCPAPIDTRTTQPLYLRLSIWISPGSWLVLEVIGVNTSRAPIPMHSWCFRNNTTFPFALTSFSISLLYFLLTIFKSTSQGQVILHRTKVNKRRKH